MGYLSRYDITVVPDHLQNEVEEAIVRRVGYDPFKDECTWYDFIADVANVMMAREWSLNLRPGFVTIDRRGEEQGDVERVFVRWDGMYQRHKAEGWVPPNNPVYNAIWRTP